MAKESFPVAEGKILLIAPWEPFNSTSKSFVDKTGRCIDIGGIAYFSFSEIPKWYTEMATLYLNNVKKPEDIGEYIVVKENKHGIK